jgi:hypothetical protein
LQTYTPAQWTEARKVLLEKEKENTRQRDELARQRRELPWVKVDENYQFDVPTGNVSLSQLFRGRSQLIVYHFMFGPDWAEGCPSCSYVSDHLEPTQPHLAARDATLTMVSRAPIDKLEAYAPGLRETIIASQVITPVDLEEKYGLGGGHIHHGEQTLDQFFTFRPLIGWAQYRTPLKRLYLCGAGTHPGGGLTGLPGANAAREITRDFKERKV